MCEYEICPRWENCFQFVPALASWWCTWRNLSLFVCRLYTWFWLQCVMRYKCRFNKQQGRFLSRRRERSSSIFSLLELLQNNHPQQTSGSHDPEGPHPPLQPSPYGVTNFKRKWKSCLNGILLWRSEELCCCFPLYNGLPCTLTQKYTHIHWEEREKMRGRLVIISVFLTFRSEYLQGSDQIRSGVLE